MRDRPPSRRVLLFVAGSVVVGAAGLLLLRRGDEDGADEGAGAGGTTEVEGPVLAASGGTPPAPPSRAAWRYAPTIVEPKGPVSIEKSPRAVVGTVVLPDGKPAAGRVVGTSRVSLSDEWTPFEEGTDDDPHRTDAAGRFRFDPVDRSGVWLTLHSDREWVATPVHAMPGGPAVTIRLRARPWVSVRVVSASGAPIAGATVATNAPWNEDAPDPDFARELGVPLSKASRLTFLYFDDPFDRPGALAVGTTDAEGLARIAPCLFEHACRLTVSPPASRRDLLARVEEPWTPADATVVMYAWKPVAGVVHDLRGALVTDGHVRWQGRVGAPETARVEYDGTFQIDRAPEGPVLLEFALPGTPLPSNAGRRTASAGDERVLLTVDLGADLDVRVEGWPRAPGGVVHVTREGEGPVERASGDLDADGHARVRGLRGDVAYTVWVAPTIEDLQGDGAWRHAHREHVRVSDSPLVLSLAEGAVIEGRVAGLHDTGREGQPSLSGWALVDEHGVVARTPLEDNGRFAIRGLPSGSFTVRVVATTWGWPGTETPEAVILEGSVTASAGAKDAVVTVRRAAEGTKMPAFSR